MRRPRGEDDVALGIEKVPWDPSDPDKSLLNLYEHDTNFAKINVRWYLNDAETCGAYAKRIRVAAIVLGTIGALLPLIDAALDDQLRQALTCMDVAERAGGS